MAIANLQLLPEFDLKRKAVSWEERRAEGKKLRKAVPRESHADWSPQKNRPDPVKIVMASNSGRQKHLIPLRMGRMAASPFAFLRGSACVMARDLSTTPITGIPTVMDGDAHISNFGMYGTPQREVVFDLNDFDEATVGPWEWDLKRLVASVNVAGRSNGLNERERAAAVRRCVEGYRYNARRMQSMGFLDIWYLHAYPGRDNPHRQRQIQNRSESSPSQNALQGDAHRQSRAASKGLQPRHRDGTPTFRDDPPVLTRIDKATRQEGHRLARIRTRSDALARATHHAQSLSRHRCSSPCRRSRFCRNQGLSRASLRKRRERSAVPAGQRGHHPRARTVSPADLRKEFTHNGQRGRRSDRASSCRHPPTRCLAIPPSKAAITTSAR